VRQLHQERQDRQGVTGAGGIQEPAELVMQAEFPIDANPVQAGRGFVVPERRQEDGFQSRFTALAG
jgi:hypothetical protein